MASNSGKGERAPAPHRPAIGFRVPRLRFELRLLGLLLLLDLAVALLGYAAVTLWHISPLWRISLLAALLLALAAITSAIFRHVVRPLQTLSNVVAALRENEYSFRAREVGEGDALGDLAAQINELAGDLRVRRHRETETFALLERVVETMDLPVFAFDAESTLQLTNPAAARVLETPMERLLKQNATALGISEILACEDNAVVTLTLHGREGRWMVRRSRFYQDGMPHTLLLLSDVSGVLREQERQAWQRLIRVVAHEVNNSLTPIKSIAGSLRSRSLTQANPVDVEHGLAIIEERAESLNRFLQTYSQLAKLPRPQKSELPLAPLLQRVCQLETRISVQSTCSTPVALRADGAQLEQALINLVRNAVDAALEANPSEAAEVQVSCAVETELVRISIEDNGPGLANPTNLFIPFYTTKPGGSGIGLILALQIIEAHGGTLTLANRGDSLGCHAQIRLPL